MKERFTRREMENAVLLAADLYQRMYDDPQFEGGSLEVAQLIIEEAVMMERWLTKKYGKDDDSYLDRLEEYERMMVAKYDLRLPQVTEPKEMEFFSIEDDGHGGKQIHILGYCYTEGEDNGDGPWRNVEYTFFIEPLQEFIDHLNAEENYVDNHASELTQYIGDYYDDGIVDIINHYFNGETANDVLHYSEITIDTPCGDYMFET